jgi:hypothetical protein
MAAAESRNNINDQSGQNDTALLNAIPARKATPPIT